MKYYHTTLRIIAIGCSALILSACDVIIDSVIEEDTSATRMIMGTGNKPGYLTPLPIFLEMPEHEGEYGEGFRDGCITALGTTGFGVIRNNDFKYDPNRGIENREYYQGFRMGSTACVYYMDYDIL